MSDRHSSFALSNIGLPCSFHQQDEPPFSLLDNFMPPPGGVGWEEESSNSQQQKSCAGNNNQNRNDPVIHNTQPETAY